MHFVCLIEIFMPTFSPRSAPALANSTIAIMGGLVDDFSVSVSRRLLTELLGVEPTVEGETERGDCTFLGRWGCRDTGSSFITRGFGTGYRAMSMVSMSEILVEHDDVEWFAVGRVRVPMMV